MSERKYSVRIELHVDTCDERGRDRQETGKRNVYHSPPTNKPGALVGWYKVFQMLTGGNEEGLERAVAAARNWEGIADEREL